MQQPKKRNPKDMAPRAYTLFKRAERTNRALTVDVICNSRAIQYGRLKAIGARNIGNSCIMMGMEATPLMA